MHRGLGGAVDRGCHHRHEGQPRGNVDDQRAWAGFQMRQKLLDHPHRPAQVDLDLTRHVGEVAVLVEALIAHDAGVVDEGVERRKLRHDALVERRDGRRIAHVALHDMHVG